jgi:REP element-mobilizing transposase RayT
MWVDENFDHWCRTPEKVAGVIRYIKNNPVKARLVTKSEDWPWMK